MGQEGRCRQTSLCVGSTRRVPATRGLPRTGVSVLSPSALLRLPAALHGAGPALSAVQVFGSSTKARIRLRLHVVSSPASAVQAARGLGVLSLGAARLFPPRRVAWAARGLGSLSTGAARLFSPWRAAQAARGLRSLSRVRRAFSLRGPSARRRSHLRKSLDRTGGLFAVWERVASLGLSLPLPSPLPPSSSGDGPALLWSFSVPLFCEPPAVCSGRLIFPCSPIV